MKFLLGLQLVYQHFEKGWQFELRSLSDEVYKLQLLCIHKTMQEQYPTVHYICDALVRVCKCQLGIPLFINVWP